MKRKKYRNRSKKLRTLLAAIRLNPLAEDVKMSIFVEGLCTEDASTEVLSFHPSFFKDAVGVALNAEFNFKAARYGTQYQNLSSVGKSEPMDLSHARKS